MPLFQQIIERLSKCNHNIVCGADNIYIFWRIEENSFLQRTLVWFNVIMLIMITIVYNIMMIIVCNILIIIIFREVPPRPRVTSPRSTTP